MVSNKSPIQQSRFEDFNMISKGPYITILNIASFKWKT